MAAEDASSRQARIEKAYVGIERLQTKLQGKRRRLRLRERVEEAAQKILKEAGAERWVRVEIGEWKEPVYRQEQRGHPGSNTRYIEALLFLYFVALLVHALLEREVRRGMAREQLDRLPLYPEERECRAPSTERILDVFGLMRLPTSLFKASR